MVTLQLEDAIEADSAFLLSTAAPRVAAVYQLSMVCLPKPQVCFKVLWWYFFESIDGHSFNMHYSSMENVTDQCRGRETDSLTFISNTLILVVGQCNLS
jgi:hypothetical protein